MKLPEGPRGRAKAAHISKETKVPVEKRLEQFPDNGLHVSAGQIYCGPCKTVIDNIKSSISDHVKRNKHISNCEKYLKRASEDDTMKVELSQYFQEHANERGSSTKDETHLFRYRCVEAFVATGTPLFRIDKFRPLLERTGISLADSSDLRATYIPRIQEHELKLLRKEARNEYIASPFDGTTRLGEALAQTGRWCSKDFKLHTKLLMFRTTKNHVSAPQLASLLTSNLISDLRIPALNVVCLPRDSCATNGAALRVLRANPFINAVDVMCICHILSCAGERIELPTLSDFMTPWLELVGGRDPHAGAKALWAEMVAPTPVPGFSKVRWWSKAEIHFVQAENAQQLAPFLRLLRDRNIGDATTKKMLEIVRTKEAQLQLELAAMLDVRQLVKTTYELEGDRLEILIVHRRIEELRAFGRRLAANEDGVLMNVDSLLRSQAKLQVGTVISKVFAGHGTFKGQIESTEICDSTMYPGRERIAYTVRYPSDNTKEDLEDEEIRPLINVTDLPERKAMADILGKAFEYLESRLTGTCEDQYDASSCYEIFRLVQVFDPQYATNHLTTAWVDNFAIITPLANLADLNEMKKEMHSYMTAATNFSVSSVDIDIYSDCILSWWRTNGASFPSWATAARIVFAFTPNSASVERVFAKLRNMFDVDQMRTLGDQMRAGLMLACNGRTIG